MWIDDFEKDKHVFSMYDFVRVYLYVPVVIFIACLYYLIFTPINFKLHKTRRTRHSKQWKLQRQQRIIVQEAQEEFFDTDNYFDNLGWSMGTFQLMDRRILWQQIFHFFKYPLFTIFSVLKLWEIATQLNFVCFT